MRDPQFLEDLRKKTKGKGAPLPPPPKNLLTKRVKGRRRSALGMSIGIHAALVLLWVGSSQWGWDIGKTLLGDPPLKPKPFKSAIRVDMVGLPDMKLSEMQDIDLTKDVGKPKAEEKAPPPKPSEKAMTLPSDKNKKVGKAVAKDDAQKRLEDLRQSLRAESRRKQLMEKLGGVDGGRQALGGNIKSEGYSLVGDVAQQQEVWGGRAGAHLRNFWKVPAWVNASNLRATIKVRIAPDGRLLEKQFIRRSGNADFDRYVERAIDGAEPFPAPPDGLKKILMESGIEWGFPI